MEPPDLTDKFADLVAGADDGWQLVEQALELVVSLTGARRAAAFVARADALEPIASYAVEGADLPAIQARCAACRPLLETGRAGYVAEPAEGAAGGSVVVPGFNDDWIGLALVARSLVVLVHVDSDSPNYEAGHTIELLAKSARLIAGRVATADTTAAAAEEAEAGPEGREAEPPAIEPDPVT
jgi:hypothetical protein